MSSFPPRIVFEIECFCNERKSTKFVTFPTPNLGTMQLSAIKSFPCSSAGGPDRMRLQHLKDTLSHYKGELSPFLTSLTAFCQLVLEGRVPVVVRPLFFGATLTALEKKSGGVRFFAVSCTLRQQAAKIAG